MEREMQEARDKASDKIRKRESFGAEPASGNVASIAVRLPSGQRLERKFAGGESIGRVYDWVDGFGDLQFGAYDLCTSFPRTVLEDREVTVAEAGLIPQAMLMVAERD